MSIEHQLASIKSKAEMQLWVDTLPDNARGVILVETGDDDRECIMKYREMGKLTMAECLYLIETYKYYLMNEAMKR